MTSIARRSVFGIAALIWVCISTITFSQDHLANNQIEWMELPSLPPVPGKKMQFGVSSPFAGISNDALIVAGGCNFPDTPLHLGGSKIYYDDVFVLERSSSGFEWFTGFKLPYKVAYGASVTLESGLVCIGGNNMQMELNKVIFLKWDSEEKKIIVHPWPDLPFSMAQMTAAKVDNKIYVAGGTANGQPDNKFLCLDLSKMGNFDFAWEILPEFPGPPRLQPVGVAQNSAEEQWFYLFSGSSYPDDAEDPFILANGLVYNPRTEKWKEIDEINTGSGTKYSLHGASGVAIGVHHILFIGGVNPDIFREAWKRERQLQNALKNGRTEQIDSLKREVSIYYDHSPEWYGFNKGILIYHTITDTWSISGAYPYDGPAGALLIRWGKDLIVISGEIKPGVQTNRIVRGTIVSHHKFGMANWLLLGSYLAGMLFLGFYFMKREAGTNDFFKASGRVPWWAAGMSIFATMLSAITFMAIPCKTYATDWKYFPMAIAIFIMAFPVIKYYLPFFRRLNVTTAYEYLEVRFNVVTRVMASVLFIVFMIARTALVLFLPSLALTTVTGIDIYSCIVLMGLVTIIYCTMGGVEAVIWGDVIQGFVLMGGALLAVFFLVNGVEGGIKGFLNISTDFEKLKVFDFMFNFRSATFWVVILGGLANNLISYSSDQTVIQRYLTTKDEKSAGRGILMNGILSVFISIIFYLIGTGLFAFYQTNPGNLDFTMENPDSIFPFFIMNSMPAGIAGLLIAAIFAATMSTVSSNINSLSTAFTTDIYRKIVPLKSDKHYLKIARISGILLGGTGIFIAFLMVMWNILSLFDYFNYVLGLLASGLGGLFLMGIFIPRIKGNAALTGFLGGFAIVLIVSTKTDIHFLLFGFLGITGSVLIGYLASFLMPDNKGVIDGLTIRDLH